MSRLSHLQIGVVTPAPAIITFTFTLLFLVTIIATSAAQAQTFTVLHTFTGAQDGGLPMSALAIDGAGNLYGAASDDGNHGGSCPSYGCGTVFKLQQRGAGWVFSPLYSFQGRPDGSSPVGVVIGPDGSLYGTTVEGGQGVCGLPDTGCGTVFQLRPPANFCRSVSCPWNETVLHRFVETTGDGNSPGNSNLVSDAARNIYGTTYQGGANNYGTVYELTHSSGGWTESLLYSFPRGGEIPTAV